MTLKSVQKFVLKNCIYGMDIDSKAVESVIAYLAVDEATKEKLSEHIICGDALFSEELLLKLSGENGFDYVIGNPPFIGHKNIDSKYRKKLKELYSDVYYDKGDISYCFFKLSLQICSNNGLVALITSRAIVDSINGAGIRNYIENNANLIKIYDFDTIKIFENISVLSVVIFLNKDIDSRPEYQVIRYNKDGGIRSFICGGDKMNKNKWLLIDNDEASFLRKIEKRADYKLLEVVDFYQGIITGLDSIFVVNSDDIEKYNIEKDLIHRWIKNSMIQRNHIKDGELFLIYSNDITSEEEYPNAIKYISQAKYKLVKRRECVKGYRDWYELQWGRRKEIFLNPKIVFPYKAGENRFAYDDCSYFFSADVYCMVIKERFADKISYDYLLQILNSEEYNKYYRLFAKKGINEQFDYYPNGVGEIMIPIQKMN